MKATLLQNKPPKSTKEQFMTLLEVDTKEDAETTLATLIQKKLGGEITTHINFRTEANYISVGIEQKVQYLEQCIIYEATITPRTYNYFKLFFLENFPKTKQELIAHLTTRFPKRQTE